MASKPASKKTTPKKKPYKSKASKPAAPVKPEEETIVLSEEQKSLLPGKPEGMKDSVYIFCLEYVKDFNGTQAAIRAGYSEKTASQQASRLLSNVKVQECLATLGKTLVSKLDEDAERVLKETKAIAFGNPSDVLSWSGRTITLKASAELPPDALAMIESISEKVSKYGDAITVKFHSKVAALKLLADVYKLTERTVKLEAGDELKDFFASISNTPQGSPQSRLRNQA